MLAVLVGSPALTEPLLKILSVRVKTQKNLNLNKIATTHSNKTEKDKTLNKLQQQHYPSWQSLGTDKCRWLASSILSGNQVKKHAY